jgi:hypothetical protein
MANPRLRYHYTNWGTETQWKWEGGGLLELYGLCEGARGSSSTDIVSQDFPGSGRRVRQVGMPWLMPGVSSAVTLGDIIFPFIAHWRGF